METMATHWHQKEAMELCSSSHAAWPFQLSLLNITVVHIQAKSQLHLPAPPAVLCILLPRGSLVSLHLSFCGFTEQITFWCHDKFSAGIDMLSTDPNMDPLNQNPILCSLRLAFGNKLTIL